MVRALFSPEITSWPRQCEEQFGCGRSKPQPRGARLSGHGSASMPWPSRRWQYDASGGWDNSGGSGVDSGKGTHAHGKQTGVTSCFFPVWAAGLDWDRITPKAVDAAAVGERRRCPTSRPGDTVASLRWDQLVSVGRDNTPTAVGGPTGLALRTLTGHTVESAPGLFARRPALASASEDHPCSSVTADREMCAFWSGVS